MSPTAPPLAFTRYQRSPHRSPWAARSRSGLALRLTDPTRATALGWKNSSRSPRRCGTVFLGVGVVPGEGVFGDAAELADADVRATARRPSAGRGLARQHR